MIAKPKREDLESQNPKKVIILPDWEMAKSRSYQILLSVTQWPYQEGSTHSNTIVMQHWARSVLEVKECLGTWTG